LYLERKEVVYYKYIQIKAKETFLTYSNDVVFSFFNSVYIFFYKYNNIIFIFVCQYYFDIIKNIIKKGLKNEF